MKVIEVCITVFTIVEVVAFIQRMVDFGLGLYFRKKDEKNVKSTLDNLQRLTFMITDLDSRVKELEKDKEQLSEAKKLLINFVSKMKTSNSICTTYDQELVDRAEQLIKEIEK